MANNVEKNATSPYVAPYAPKANKWNSQMIKDFMKELADFVYKNHVVDDKNSIIYGMTYEFWKDEKKMQVFSLDTMHDGAWFAEAMLIASLIDNDSYYKNLALSYQIPFYLNMLNNSDSLFPKMRAYPEEEKKNYEKPLKGWAPRGWDDGTGVDFITKAKFDNRALFSHASTNFQGGSVIEEINGEFKHAYFTTSNHLLQVLASLMITTWMTTKDISVQEATKNIFENRKAMDWLNIKTINFAYAFTNNQIDSDNKYFPPKFSPKLLYPYYQGLYEQRKCSIPSYNDTIMWDYRITTAFYFMGKNLFEDPDVIQYFAGYAYTISIPHEMYWDDQPYKYGLGFFDIQRPPEFIEGKGKLDSYLSNSNHLMGSRAIEFSSLAAAILPAIAKKAELWEDYYRKNYSNDILIRFVDISPKLDGIKDNLYDLSGRINLQNTEIFLVSDPKNLNIFLSSSLPEIHMEIQPLDEIVGQRGIASIKILPKQAIVKNHNDEELLFSSAFTQQNNKWTAELRIPYTVVRGQNQWINGIEHGRYMINVNKTFSQNFYMLSTGKRIVSRLEEIVLGTIENYYNIWKQYGFIPSGIRNPNSKNPHSWEISDAGSTAHLIKTLAYWLIYISGQSEWELLKKNQPSTPITSKLPNTVLIKQGLK